MAERVIVYAAEAPVPHGCDEAVLRCVRDFCRGGSEACGDGENSAARCDLMCAGGACGTIERPFGGKPRLSPACGVIFSVSHTEKKSRSTGDKRLWMCAVARCELGLDVQAESSSADTLAVARRFFSRAEAEFIERGGDFYDVWAAKESYVKYTGVGVSDGFGGFSVTRGGVIADEVDGARLYRIELGDIGAGVGRCHAYLCCAVDADIELRIL